MKNYFSLLLLITFSSIFAQTYHIKDFSKEYSAVITKNKKGEDYSLNIIENNSKKTLIKENLNLNEYDFEDTKSNVRELPYGHQSIIIYDDFNFDGKKDIAIKYGNESCYSGPSYIVYLGQKKGFKYNADFSDLAQSYCGFFDVDYEKKQIHTMTKSGCCWHQFSDFIVKNGKPFLIKQVEEEYTGSYVLNKIKEWKGNKYYTHTEKNIDNSDFENAIFKFELENGKYLVLSLGENKNLYYYFLNKNQNLEMDYSDKFFYSKKENSLSFSTDSADYKIYNDKIEITYNKKTTILKANIKTRKNNISDIYAKFREANIENLEIVD